MASVKVCENWQANKSLAERNRFMLDRQLYTDVNFVFENKGAREPSSPKTRVLRAHKYMLISSSAVFCSMLTGGLAEEGDIPIKDVEYEAFAAMLRFIYCEELNLTGETVMQILYASKKYIIPAITTQCSTFLEQELTSENVCTILDQALIFEEQDLVEKCLTVVKQNTAEVFGTDGFMTLSYSAVAKLLELQELSVREIDVFKACMKWARDKIKKDTGEEIRQKLGDLLYKIRFPVMTAEEFSLHVSPVGVLSHVEEIACFRYICSGQGKDNLPFIAQTRGIIPKALFCGLERPYETTLVPINNGSSFQNLNITSCGERSIMDKTPTKVSGLRLLCTEGDSFSLKISRKLRMEKHKRLPYRMSQTYETIYAIDKHPVTSLMMDEEETYADIYFPNEHTVDLEVGDNYRFEVNLSHCSTSAENIVFQQYALVDHVIFRHNDHVASSIHRFAQEKTLMLGILVKED